ncbi:phage tail fiber protein [Paenibacillus pabuli]|uniref:phage tail fiber protein n=1 Tax=Paenibacillus pabuli TaxID=1472 RepID=UPI003CE7D28F
MNISKYLATKQLNVSARGEKFTFPDRLYVALYTSDPTWNDTGQEVSGGGYARQVIFFADPAQIAVQEFHPVTGVLSSIQKMAIKSAADVAFAVASANWGTVTHFGLRDAVTGGNLYYFGTLETPRSILNNDIFKFLTGQVEIRLN